MNQETKRIKVFIFDQQYSLVSDETEDIVRRAAFLVDKYMQDICHKSDISDSGKVAVLAALQIATEIMALKITLEMHEETCKRLINLAHQGLSFASFSHTA